MRQEQLSDPVCVERFWDKVAKTDECWLWTASLSLGYGQFAPRWKGPRWFAHRFAYELLVGPIPEGLELHHKCWNRACVNPDHLEAVTHRQNCLYGPGMGMVNAAKTHCSHGHLFDDENTYFTPKGDRQCRTCQRAFDRKRRPRGVPRKKAA